MDEDQNRFSEEEAVRKVVEDWAAAVRQRDLPAILRHHSPDILMFDVPPPFQSKGIEAYRKTWDLFFSWAHDPAIFDIKEMKVIAGSDVAFVAASMRCTGKEPGGEDFALDFRLTVGLHKVDGQWMIIHEHHSVPADD